VSSTINLREHFMNTRTTPPLMTPEKYDLTYKLLHWFMAILILMMFMAGIGFGNAKNEQEMLTMLTGHSSIGIIVSCLLFLRILKRFVKRDPVPAHDLPRLQQRLATMVHYAIYILLILIPLTGYLTARAHELPVNAFGSFNLNSGLPFNNEHFTNIRAIHETCTKLLMLVLTGHIGAALMHGFIKKDNVLKSMSLFRKKV